MNMKRWAILFRPPGYSTETSEEPLKTASSGRKNGEHLKSWGWFRAKRRYFLRVAASCLGFRWWSSPAQPAISMGRVNHSRPGGLAPLVPHRRKAT